MECQGKDFQTLSCETLMEEVDLYFTLLRNTNQMSEDKRQISQILEDTIVKLEIAFNRFRKIRNSGNCVKIDKEAFLDRIDACMQFYLTLGTHNTSLFYEKNQIYEKLKSRPYKICTVCGTRVSVADELSELKNALAFK